MQQLPRIRVLSKRPCTHRDYFINNLRHECRNSYGLHCLHYSQSSVTSRSCLLVLQYLKTSRIAIRELVRRQSMDRTVGKPMPAVVFQTAPLNASFFMTHVLRYIVRYLMRYVLCLTLLKTARIPSESIPVMWTALFIHSKACESES